MGEASVRRAEADWRSLVSDEARRLELRQPLVQARRRRLRPSLVGLLVRWRLGGKHAERRTGRLRDGLLWAGTDRAG